MSRYRDVKNIMDEAIGTFRGGHGLRDPEKILNKFIDIKYSNIHWDILFLKRQGKSKKEIMEILGIGYNTYNKSIIKLKEKGNWKEYRKKAYDEDKKD